MMERKAKGRVFDIENENRDELQSAKKIDELSRDD